MYVNVDVDVDVVVACYWANGKTWALGYGCCHDVFFSLFGVSWG